MMENTFTNYRNIIARLFYAYCLAWMIIRGYSHTLPNQLHHPELAKPVYDITYWLYRLSNIIAVITTNYFAGLLFVVLLFSANILLVIFSRASWLSIIFTLLLLTLNVSTNIYITHSMHYLGAMIVLSCAFWTKSDAVFNLLWQGARYYACYIYASAFIWKILLGSFWQWDAGVLSFKSNIANYLLLNPETSLAHFYYFFLQHEWLLNIGQKATILAESLFIIGFFTKKYDRLLIFAAIFIFVATYIFADVFFAEQLIIIITFISPKQWSKMNKVLPILNKNYLIKTLP